MVPLYLVRIGLLGNVGRFAPVQPVVLSRGHRVVCQTSRGLEVGEVLGRVESTTAHSDGRLLRRVTVEDDLVLARLSRQQRAAYEDCARLLVERRVAAVLMDVEHLLDGESVYFYFLGELTEELTAITAELATVYEARIQFRQFAEMVANGCGPLCGTDQAEGCGTHGCASCVVAAACVKH